MVHGLGLFLMGWCGAVGCAPGMRGELYGGGDGILVHGRIGFCGANRTRGFVSRGGKLGDAEYDTHLGGC